MTRGYFGIGIYNGKDKANIGTLWRSAFNLGAKFIFVIGKRYKHQCSDTVKALKHIPFFEYDKMDDLEIPKDCKLIGVELTETARELKNYIHPERAIYLLGAEDNGLPEIVLSKCHDIIKIDSQFCMNVAVAGSIVMYDRKVKA